MYDDRSTRVGYDNLIFNPGTLAYHCRACSAVILNVTLHEWCCPGRTEEFRQRKIAENQILARGGQ